MTSPAATVNVTFDSVDCTDINGIFLHRIVAGGPGTLPEVDGKDDALLGADGIFIRNRRKRTRRIELRGFVRGIGSSEATDRDDYWANREALEALFDPTATATLRVDTGAAAYTIVARPLPSPVYDEEAPSFAEVSVVLESTVPDWTIGT